MKNAVKKVPIGAGGGGSTQRPPTESPDSLVSIGYARILDLVSEGEIKGLVDGPRSIFLDGTPAQTGDILNFPGFTWDYRSGTQDQPHMAGFPSVESNISVNVELEYGVPFIRAVNNTQISAIRVNLRVPQLTRQDLSTGDITGYVLSYQLEVAQGAGPFVPVKVGTMRGKTTGGYDRSERIDLPGNPSGGWRIRVSRTQPASSTSNIQDRLFITSVSEIIDAKFRYPNSAYFGTEFNAQTFGGAIPPRSFLIDGRIVRVPQNYDPETRTYSGVWNGANWKTAYTNNPVWCYLDLLLHPRYGLGDRITMANVDRWSLYQIAQYCDQMVPDGKGGQEPRFTLNTYIQSQTDAFKLLQDLTSVFRGITYWGAGLAVTSADMPSDPVYTYTNANVINGEFAYRGGKRSTRYTAANVSWNDPEDRYKIKAEYVPNDDAIARHGLRKADISAFGATSQGQAQRLGHWTLLTNNLEQDTVTFSVGLDYMFARPGAVIRIADNNRAGRRIGGRISSASRTSVTVDALLPVQDGDWISCNMPDGSSETRRINAVSGRTIEVEAFSVPPMSESAFVVESSALMSQLFRVISITENGPMQYTITALQHEPQKYGAIDSQTLINPRPISELPTSLQAPPTNLRMTSDYAIDQFAAVTTLAILWDAAPGAASYEVEWRRDDGPWNFAGRTGQAEIFVTGIFAGTYSARVKALNTMGVASVWTALYDQFIDGKADNLTAPLNFRTSSEIFGIRVDWDVPAAMSDMKFTELQMSATGTEGEFDIPEAAWLSAFPNTTYLHSGMAAGVAKYFRGRFVDTTGNLGPWTAWTYGMSSNSANILLEYLTGEITETELGGQLLEEITKISGDGPGSVNERLSEYMDYLQTELGNIQSQLAELEGVQPHDPLIPYASGTLVSANGGLYRAIRDVPENIAITDPAYWEKIGDFASLGEAVGALTVQLSQVQLVTDALTQQVVSQAEALRSVRSWWREEDGEGELMGAIEAFESRAGFFEEVRTRTSQNTAMAQRITSLSAETAQAAASITQLEQVFATEMNAMASRLDTMTVSIEGNSANIVNAQQALVTLEQSTAQQMSQISAKFELTDEQMEELETASSYNEAAIANLSTVVVNLDSATANSVAELNSRVDDTEATIQVTQSTVVNVNNRVTGVDGRVNNLDNRVMASYNIKLGVTVGGRYYAAGMGIGIENSPSGMQTQVLFLADRFAVLNTATGTPQSPFIIQNNQVFMSSAFIQEASITMAKIAGALQSDNYVPNSQGWQLSRNGNFEINGTLPGQGRVRLTNQVFEVYDTNNIRRVRLGLWNN